MVNVFITALNLMKKLILLLFFIIEYNSAYSQSKVRDAYIDSILLDSRINLIRGFYQDKWFLRSKPLNINCKIFIEVLKIDSAFVRLIEPNLSSVQYIRIDSFNTMVTFLSIKMKSSESIYKSKLNFIQSDYSRRSNDKYKISLKKINK